MNSIIIRRILHRVWKFAFIEINLSVMLTVLSLAEIFTTQWAVFHSTAVAGVIYVLVNIFRMRISFYELAEPSLYYFYNLISYGIFAIISIVVYFVADSAVYTWLFAVLKVFRYYNNEIETIISAIFVHLIMIAAIIFAPIGIEEIPED